MTRRLLLALVEGHPPMPLAVLSGLGLLVALPFLVLLDLARFVVERRRERALLAKTSARCPRGHDVALVGAWACPGCRLVIEGHAFAACPHCGVHAAAAIRCACGLPVRSPLWEEE